MPTFIEAMFGNLHSMAKKHSSKELRGAKAALPCGTNLGPATPTAATAGPTPPFSLYIKPSASALQSSMSGLDMGSLQAPQVVEPMCTVAPASSASSKQSTALASSPSCNSIVSTSPLSSPTSTQRSAAVHTGASSGTTSISHPASPTTTQPESLTLTTSKNVASHAGSTMDDAADTASQDTSSASAATTDSSSTSTDAPTGSNKRKPLPRSARMKQAHRARQLLRNIVVQDTMQLLGKRGRLAQMKTAALVQRLHSVLSAKKYMPGVLKGDSLGAGGQGVVRRVSLVKNSAYRCDRPGSKAKKAPRMVHPYAHKARKQVKLTPADTARKFMVLTLKQIEKEQHVVLGVKGLSMTLCNAVEPAYMALTGITPGQASHILQADAVHVIPVSDCRKALLACVAKSDLKECDLNALEGEAGVLIALDMPCADRDLRLQYQDEHGLVGPGDESVPADMLGSLTGLPFGAHHVNVPALCDLVVQACEGVAETEAYGLLHGDLKPSNFMVMGKRTNKYDTYQPGTLTVKLGDFGAATLQAQDAGDAVIYSKDALLGTPTYWGNARRDRQDKTLYASDELDSTLLMCFELALGCPMRTAKLWLHNAALWLSLPQPKQRAELLSCAALQQLRRDTACQAIPYVKLLRQLEQQGPAGVAYVALLRTLGYAQLQRIANPTTFTAADLAEQLQQLQEQVLVPLQQGNAAVCMLLLPHSSCQQLPIAKTLLLPQLAQAALDEQYLTALCARHPDAISWLKNLYGDVAKLVGDYDPPSNIEYLTKQYQDWCKQRALEPAAQQQQQQQEEVVEGEGEEEGEEGDATGQGESEDWGEEGEEGEDENCSVDPKRQQHQQEQGQGKQQEQGCTVVAACCSRAAAAGQGLSPCKIMLNRIKRWRKQVLGCVKPHVLNDEYSSSSS